MEKFRNKYRIASSRASWWNYGWNGAYFITICTKGMAQFFGLIENGRMKLSPQGLVADVLWYELKAHARNLELGAFVVMPNHIHGVLILNRPKEKIETLKATIVEQSYDSEILAKNEKMAAISPKANTISSIVRSYKSAVSRHVHRLGYEFEWQPRFHDHIIRNQEDYQRISSYIENNPATWNEDKYR